MSYYVGNGLVFPIKGREDIGAELKIDLNQLALAVEKFKKVSPYENLTLVFTVLPMKPENVTDKNTHSVKLTNIIESQI